MLVRIEFVYVNQKLLANLICQAFLALFILAHLMIVRDNKAINSDIFSDI